MKNNLQIIFFIFVFCSQVLAENIFIESKNISIDKKSRTSIFKDEVKITTKDKKVIKSDYAEYNKETGDIILKENILTKDKFNNLIKTNYAEFNEFSNIFKSKGFTEIITGKNYNLIGSDIIFNNEKKIINSSKETKIIDPENNEILLQNFEYLIDKNIFKSVGKISITDNKSNKYNFSQIYIDTKKKEILGTDSKFFFNDKQFKVHPDNKPRIFSNTVNFKKDKNIFNKSIFSQCAFRKDDSCPPWSIQASQILHDNKKKTIYYDNAVIKIYDIPLFYLPKLSHPDPTVKRRSGFLVPRFFYSKNLGSAITVPYFVDLGEDKDFTFTNKLFFSEHPLLLGEYRQAFKNSNLILDFGYSEGYKKANTKKSLGSKNHFFSKYVKYFDSDNFDSSLELNIQDVSDDKYIKLYKLDSDIKNSDEDFLENSITLNYEEDDKFFRFKTSMFETLKDNYTDKYEYVAPEITFDKNIFSNYRLGSLDYQADYKANYFDINKSTKILSNNFTWDFKEFQLNNGLKNKLFSKIKNVNYEAKNVGHLNHDTTTEIYSAFGYLTELDLIKEENEIKFQKIVPKILLRYSPGSMSKEDSGARLDAQNIFSLDRIESDTKLETGLSATLGFDYELKDKDKDFQFSMGQIISEKENKNMPTSTSLDEKLSDLVGSSSLKIGENLKLKYDFAIDQNYKEFNSNEFGAEFNISHVKFNFDYLLEDKHIGDQEYLKTNISFYNNNNTKLSLSSKRNLVKNSSEFYDLSYEYLNDCLRAGLVYRREFYQDSELEPEDSLMFKITIVPLGQMNMNKLSLQ